MGDVVNMSARLMGKADRNTVLCDASTAGDAGDVFSFKEAMRIKVGGLHPDSDDSNTKAVAVNMYPAS